MEHLRDTGCPPPREALTKDLCNLLAEQIACVREGKLSRLEQLNEQTNAAVAEVARAARDDPLALAGEREHLKKLYAELVLALKAERDDVYGRLTRLRKVRRAVGAYRGGIHTK